MIRAKVLGGNIVCGRPGCRQRPFGRSTEAGLLTSLRWRWEDSDDKPARWVRADRDLRAPVAGRSEYATQLAAGRPTAGYGRRDFGQPGALRHLVILLPTVIQCPCGAIQTCTPSA